MLSEESSFLQVFLEKLFFDAIRKKVLPLCAALLEPIAFSLLSLCVELFLTVSRVSSSRVGLCHLDG